MNKNKVIIMAVILQIIGFASWSVQSSGTSAQLNDVDFVDVNHGWAVAGEWYQNDAVILHTSDGGRTWVDQTPNNIPDGIDALDGVSFVDTLTGWAVGVDTFRCSLILRTTDGGSNWLRQTAPIDTPTPISVYFVDQNNGWTSPGGPYGPDFQQVIFHTTNGGNTWQVQGWGGYDGGSCRIFFADLQHGYVAGGTEMTPTTRGYIMGTTDGGNTWLEQYDWEAFIPWTYPLMTGVHFPVDAVNGWGCGSLYGLVPPADYEIHIVRTTDGGWTWDDIAVITDTSIGKPRDIHMVDLQNGWTVGRGGDILRTTDGFNTWHLDTSGVNVDLRAVDFVDLNNGWAVGKQGTIIKYTGNALIDEQATLKKVSPGSKLTTLLAKKDRLRFFFTSPVDQPVVFTVYNTQGQIICSQKIFVHQGETKCDLCLPSGLSAGVYLLNARTNTGLVGGKFVILK